MTSPLGVPDEEDLLNINVIRDFTYTIESSSLTYIRNYNFNKATATPINVILQNKSRVVPITVDISASAPWMQIIEPGTNRNVITPRGNIVLPISSSRRVQIIIDLPPEIEAIPDPTTRVSMSFYLRSGSFPPAISESLATNYVIGSPTATIVTRVSGSVLAPVLLLRNDLFSTVNGNLVTFNIVDTTVATITAEYPPTGSKIFNNSRVHYVRIRGNKVGQTLLRVTKLPPPAPPPTSSNATQQERDSYESRLRDSRLPAAIKELELTVLPANLSAAEFEQQKRIIEQEERRYILISGSGQIELDLIDRIASSSFIRTLPSVQLATQR